ncbi:hypothetical protein ACLOJK_027562 [Asimina triloba]
MGTPFTVSRRSTEHQYGTPSSSSPIQQHTAPRLLHLPMADRSAMTSTPTSYRRQLHRRQRRLLPQLLPSPSTARTAHEQQPSDALVPLADDNARPAATPLDLARAPKPIARPLPRASVRRQAISVHQQVHAQNPTDPMPPSSSSTPTSARHHAPSTPIRPSRSIKPAADP